MFCWGQSFVSVYRGRLVSEVPRTSSSTKSACCQPTPSNPTAAAVLVRCLPCVTRWQLAIVPSQGLHVCVACSCRRLWLSSLPSFLPLASSPSTCESDEQTSALVCSRSCGIKLQQRRGVACQHCTLTAPTGQMASNNRGPAGSCGSAVGALQAMCVQCRQLTGYACVALCCAGACSGWLWVTIAMNESELLATAGMDALVGVHHPLQPTAVL